MDGCIIFTINSKKGTNNYAFDETFKHVCKASMKPLMMFISCIETGNILSG